MDGTNVPRSDIVAKVVAPVGYGKFIKLAPAVFRHFLRLKTVKEWTMAIKKITNDVRGRIQVEIKGQLKDAESRGEDFAQQLRAAAEQWKAILDRSSLWDDSLSEPLAVAQDDDCIAISELVEYPILSGERWEDARSYLFQNSLYLICGVYTIAQDKLLIQEEFDSERQKFERLQRKFEGCDFEGQKVSRQQIPEEVRIAVWRRDGGTCSKCGSRERLEYDHIIPVSRGGSNTVRNIELLCEVCNRSKSNNIQ